MAQNAHSIHFLKSVCCLFKGTCAGKGSIRKEGKVHYMEINKKKDTSISINEMLK